MEEKRQMHPNSLANLKPAQPGEIRNPLGIGRKTYSLEYHAVSQEPIPEAVRVALNKKFGADLIQEGDSWARANALSMHYESVCRGMTAAAQEIREAVEGRATQRIEMAGADGAAAEHPTFHISFTDKLEGNSPLELRPADGTEPTQ